MSALFPRDTPRSTQNTRTNDFSEHPVIIVIKAKKKKKKVFINPQYTVKYFSSLNKMKRTQE